MPLILGTNSIKDTGYDVANSVRLNRGDSANFTRTPSSASNRRTWTWSGWVKRSGLGNIQTLFDGSDGGYPEIFYFDADDKFLYHHDISGSDYKLISSQVFRDVSAWLHIVVAKDTTQSTETNRLKVYVNGSQITMNESALGYPTQNFEGAININDLHIIGNWKTNSYYVDGYLCEVAFIDGTQLDATSFGEFDSDSPTIWKPKDFKDDVTFGTNGFYLDFEDSSALGNDVSGNNNDFTANNLTATDQTTDTCTNNFMTLNPLSTDSGVTLSEGNTESDYDASVGNAKGNIGLTRGRWYWEVKLTNSTSGYPMIGIGSMNESQMQKPTGGSYAGGFSNSYGVYGSNLRLYANGSNLGDQGSSYTTGDVFGIYLDLESSTKTIKWYKNGSSVLSYNITNAGADYPYTCIDYNGGESSVNVNYNFGNPAYTISSGNADDNGYGNFEYSPNISSTKYYAVCTKNLAEYG